MSSPPTPYIYRVLSPRACEVCKRRDGLLLCMGCFVVSYCGIDHQVADRQDHKLGCVAMKKRLNAVEREEKKLRDFPGDALNPANPFENSVGHFWDINATRPYMKARFRLVGELLEKFGNLGCRAHAVEIALDHLLDMMQLSRRDHLAIRDIVPALYIRLGKDQEAYDFLRWRATTGESSINDWGDLSLPFLDVKNADMLEQPEPSWINAEFMPLSQAVAATLVKIRLLLDLKDLQNANRSLQGTVPLEIIDLIRCHLVSGAVASRFKRLATGIEETSREVEKLKRQILLMVSAIDRYNTSFWPLLIHNPIAAIRNMPIVYMPRSYEEACLMIGYNFNSWAETPKAVDTIVEVKTALNRKTAHDEECAGFEKFLSL